MKCTIKTTKDKFLNMLLYVIAKVDVQKGSLDKIDCQAYSIEYSLPEAKPSGSLD